MRLLENTNMYQLERKVICLKVLFSNSFLYVILGTLLCNNDILLCINKALKFHLEFSGKLVKS